MGGVFKGLFIFVQVKDRPGNDVWKDIRTIQVSLEPSFFNDCA